MIRVPQANVTSIAQHSELEGFRLLAHHDLNGYGDGFQVIQVGEWLYVAHLGTSPMALSILDCTDPSRPEMVRQVEHPPNTRCHKVQVVDDILIQNNELPYWQRGNVQPGEKRGLSVFHLTDPSTPQLVGFHPSAGEGTHRLWFSELPYAHIASFQAGDRYRSYEIVDLTDIGQPRSAGGWWIPGSRPRDSEPWLKLRDEERFGIHGVIPHGSRAYAACLDAGMAVLDITDVSSPSLLGSIDWSPPYGGFVHTTLPLAERELVVASDEGLLEHVHGGEKRIWIIDVREPRQPVTISSFPEPIPPSHVGASSFRQLPGRYGPHNLHENRPGSFISETVIFATYFNAGLRVYDISDQYRPEEVGHFLPPAPPGQDAPMLNDLYVNQNGTVFVTDRGNGGLYILQFEG